MYATAAARGDGLLLLCGGRDAGGTPMGDAYGFARHRDGRWEWHAAPGAMPTGRYQHGAIFVGNRLHISGGAVGGGRMVRRISSYSHYYVNFSMIHYDSWAFHLLMHGQAISARVLV